MVLGLVTTSAVCFMLFVRDHPYSAVIFGLLAILPIAYFFKTYAGPAFPLHLPTQQPIDFCLVLTRVRAVVRVCSFPPHSKQTFVPETFKCPLVPLTPILGILSNIYLMANLTAVRTTQGSTSLCWRLTSVRVRVRVCVCGAGNLVAAVRVAGPRAVHLPGLRHTKLASGQATKPIQRDLTLLAELQGLS